MKQKSKNTICLCSIVKDEAGIIERMIRSVIDVIDTWLIIDTGSTDGTQEVITRALKDVPGELLESKWVNFGHNRTELLEKARGKADYLLLLDADMILNVKDSFDKDSFTENSYHVRYTGNLDFTQLLFIKSDLNWKYIGVTHEYLFCDDFGPAPITDGFDITHYGDGHNRKDKAYRDIALLLDDIEKHPKNARSYFYLGQSYMLINDYDHAIEYYKKRVELGGWAEEVYYSLYQAGMCYIEKRQPAKGIAHLLRAHNVRPTRFEVLYALGQYYRTIQNYHTAILFLDKARSIPYPKDYLFIHKDQFDYLIDFELAICYFYAKEYGKAKVLAENVEQHQEAPKYIRDQNRQNLNFINDAIDGKKSGKNKVIYCSMFTTDTPYEKVVLDLKQTMDQFNVKYELVGVVNRGSWIKNTQMKPAIILNTMKKYNTDIVWLDADALMKKKPVLFDKIDTDIGFYFIKEWDEFITGTMYFRNCEKVRNFLQVWADACIKSDKPDGPVFQEEIKKRKDIRIEFLPPDYCKIFDNELIHSLDPVIVHTQVSRKYRDKINGKKSTQVYDTISILRNSHDHCTIVGNGPYTNTVPNIDDTFVVRCNNFKMFEELGSRIDLNISSLFHEIVPEMKVDYPIFGILPLSQRTYEQYTDAKKMHVGWANNAYNQRLIGNKVITYGENDTFADLFKIIADEINAFPTVGILAIGMALWLGFKKISVIGFTFFQTEKSHYWTDKVVKPSMHHNPEAEAALLRKWVEQDTVKWYLDDLTIKSIQHATSKSESVK